MWKTKIGARAISEVNETSIGYYVDENSQWLGPTNDARKQSTSQSITKQSRDQYTRRTSSKSRSNIRRNKRSGFYGIQIPVSIMLNEWYQDELQEKEVSENATSAMSAVDAAMKNLRKSRTVNALERSSLDVAVALVNVASHEECHNPFLCLQQAAVFSAMGPKLGNSDEPVSRAVFIHSIQQWIHYVLTHSFVVTVQSISTTSKEMLLFESFSNSRTC